MKRKPGNAICLGGEVRVVRAAAAPEHRSRSGTRGERLFQRQRRRAESAFRRESADDPVGAAAAGAVIDLAIVIDGVLAPRVGIERGPGIVDRTQHGVFLRNHLDDPTSGESLGFIGDR